MSELKRTLGLPALCFYAIGMILGAGIYSVIGQAAAVAGHGLWLSFALGSAVALLTGLSYAELATMMPSAGAEYVYLREALPTWSWLSTVIGVLLVLSGLATATTVALAFAGYLSQLMAAPAWLVAPLLIVVLSLVSIVGLRESTWVNIAFTSIEIAGLLLVIWVGTRQPHFAAQALSHLGPEVLPGAALVFFSFLGFEEIANLAEEARNPGRDIPRAILLSVLVTTTLYVLVALSVTSLLAPEHLGDSDAPLSAAVSQVSKRHASVLGAVALFATANTGLVALVVSARMMLGMSRARVLPAVFARVSPKRGTPLFASLAACGGALLLTPIGGLGLVAGMSSFGALVAFLVVNACVLVLRSKQPERARPFRVPVSIGRFAVLPMFGIIASLVLLASFDGTIYLGGAIALAIGLCLHAFNRIQRGAQQGAEERSADDPGAPLQ